MALAASTSGVFAGPQAKAFRAGTAPRPSAGKAPAPARVVFVRSAAPGGGVADRPTLAPDVTKRPDQRRYKPPTYRVLLHNDRVNKREYVVKVLLKVVEGYTVEDAVNVMHEAHINGLALVTQCAQELAERYCEGMRNSGLTSTIEPAGRGA